MFNCNIVRWLLDSNRNIITTKLSGLFCWHAATKATQSRIVELSWRVHRMCFHTHIFISAKKHSATFWCGMCIASCYYRRVKQLHISADAGDEALTPHWEGPDEPQLNVFILRATHTWCTESFTWSNLEAWDRSWMHNLHPDKVVLFQFDGPSPFLC